MLFSSCGSDVECTVEDFNTMTAAQLSALNSAIDALNANNSDDTCNAVRDEAESYIDLLNDFQDCEELAGADVATAISTTQDLLTSLPCN